MEIAMKNNILYYNTPATKWIEALPIGNGRVGAMVFGGANREHLQLNEETLWSGYFDKLADNPETAKHIDEIRELLFAKKTYEAEKLELIFLEHILHTRYCVKL